MAILGEATIGVDLASGPDLTALVIGGRTGGKTEAIRKYVDAYLKAHPDTTVAYYINGQLIIEKPVKG